MSSSVDLDEAAHYEPSHLDLGCLQKPITIAYGCERVKMQRRKFYTAGRYVTGCDKT